MSNLSLKVPVNTDRLAPCLRELSPIGLPRLEMLLPGVSLLGTVKLEDAVDNLPVKERLSE